ncbi:DUF5710 domain-containing protein [Methylomonas sp. MgM2]
MPESKTYLNVPYAEKDAAKARGARWDPTNKKWYVPAGKNTAPFEQWRVTTNPQPAKPKTSNNSAAVSSNKEGAYTYPTIEEFVAYSGDLPPWD